MRLPQNENGAPLATGRHFEMVYGNTSTDSVVAKCTQALRAWLGDAR
jgi:hypothetical protein